MIPIMLQDADRVLICEVGRRYGAARILLFGSAGSSEGEGVDIDLAVEGLDPGLFFRFYADLILGLSKPVDLIDLSQDTKFNAVVRAEGIPVYG